MLRALTIATAVCAGPARAADAVVTNAGPDSEANAPVILLTDAERADFAKVRAFFVDGAHASDARLRTLVGLNQTFIDEADLPAAQRVPVDALAEQARGSTDPFVLSLLVQGCGLGRLKPKPTCSAVALARQWTVADTQNQVAWLTLASTLRGAGDADGSRAAFARGAQASTWHEPYDDGPRVVATALPKSLGPRARIALQYHAVTSSYVWLLPTAAIQELDHRCKDDTLGDACRRIVDTIDRDGTTMFSRQMAISIGRRHGIEGDVTERRSRAIDALRFASTLAGMKEWGEITDPAELEGQARLWDRRVALGEIGWARELLDAGGPTRQVAADSFHMERNAARVRSEADAQRRAAAR